MITKVAIAGAAGRMGQTLVQCATKLEDIELVGATEHPAHEALGSDVGTLAGIDPVGIFLTANLDEALAEADVIIDFTVHQAVPINAKKAAGMGRAAVIGTTALTDDETAVVLQAADKIPIVWAPNMSLGVNLLFAMSKRAAEVLGDGYRVVIEDTHHIHKIDAPSGTALRLGEKVAEGAKVDFKKVYIHDEGGKESTYPPGSIPIRSYRKGEVVGDHTVSFENDGERIELTHHAWSREAFAMGALHAAKWVSTKRPRIYDMQDVLGLNT